MINGNRSLYTSSEDCKLIAKHYRGLSVDFAESSCMPFAEETEKFNKLVGKFLAKFTRKKEPATETSSSSSSAAGGR